MKIKYLALAAVLFSFAACNDNEDKNVNSGGADEQGVLVMCEGSYGMNNGALSYIGKDAAGVATVVSDVFSLVNNRGLGDTPNDAIVYGSNIYIAVSSSNTIEVIDAKSGKSVKQIQLADEKEQVQPRHLVAEGNYVYVSAYNGVVYAIDTKTLEVAKTCKVSGANPEGICAIDGKLYVANSGGLNYPNYDSTLSVINTKTMTEESVLTVGLNPCRVERINNSLLCVQVIGNYVDVAGKLVIINVNDLSVSKTINVSASNFIVNNGSLIGYATTYDANWTPSVEFFKTDDSFEMQSFAIQDSNQLVTPYSLAVNATNGNIYVGDAVDYTTTGALMSFKADGSYVSRTEGLGVNPGKILFTSMSIEKR